MSRAAVVAGIVVAFGAGVILASRTSLMDARRIEVSGADHLHRADLVATAGVSKDTNVLWFDEGAARRRLEAEPWIAKAEVSGSFPLTIEIAVTERTPVAVTGGRAGSLIAGDGTADRARHRDDRRWPTAEPGRRGARARRHAADAALTGDARPRDAGRHARASAQGRDDGAVRGARRRGSQGRGDPAGARVGRRRGECDPNAVRGGALGAGGDAGEVDVHLVATYA
jgi:hypothetical protein